MTDVCLTVDEHHAVGPVGTPTDHLVLMITGAYPGVADAAADETVFACLECGLVTDDTGRFQLAECDREKNDIPKTLAEDLD